MIRGVGPRMSPVEGVGAAGGAPRVNLGWRQMLTRGIDLSRAGALTEAKEAFSVAFTAGKAVFDRIPLIDALKLAQVTHDAYFMGADKPLIEDPSSIFVDVSKIVPQTAGQLKSLLTNDGQLELDKFVSGAHIGKAFLVPAHILPGKVVDFLGFFGKSDTKAVAGLQALVDAGDKKKKIANNQAMSWETLMRRYDAIYQGENNSKMKQFQVSLQIEAVLDSAITLAALEQGIIQDSQKYSLFHVLWATHNDWQSQASVNYENLPRTEQVKDDVILDAHAALSASLRPVIDAVLIA